MGKSAERIGRSNLELLAYEPSPLCMICVRRQELLSEPGTVVTEITLDHQFLMSSHDTASERALARRGLERHRGKDVKVRIDPVTFENRVVGEAEKDWLFFARK